MGSSRWREVPFVAGRLDGQAQMVTVGPQGQLAEEIQVEAPTGQREVYQLQADQATPGSGGWTYRNPRYVLRR